MNKLPEEYIVECKNAEETNIAAYYFKKVKRLSGDDWPYFKFVYNCKRYTSDSILWDSIFSDVGDLTIIPFKEWNEIINPIEFVLPKLWCVKRTGGNMEVLNKWCNEQPGVLGTSSNSGWIHSINYGSLGHSMNGHYYADDYQHIAHTEITYEQFVKHVLNKENKMNNQISIEGSPALLEGFIKESGVKYASTIDVLKDCLPTYPYLVLDYKNRFATSSTKENRHFILPTDWYEALAAIKEAVKPTKPEPYKYKEGDWVKLVSKRPVEWNYVGEMDYLLGKVVQLTTVNRLIKFKEGGMWAVSTENIERLATPEEIAATQILKYDVGDYLYCIKDVVMDRDCGGNTEFTKGRVYKATSNATLHNNTGNTGHGIPYDFAYKYFRKATAEEIQTLIPIYFKLGKYTAYVSKTFNTITIDNKGLATVQDFNALMEYLMQSQGSNKFKLAGYEVCKEIPPDNQLYSVGCVKDIPFGDMKAMYQYTKTL
jgi:hypothetical protein